MNMKDLNVTPLSRKGKERFGCKVASSRSKVPELFIEVPESTTVGSLKRTVLDAMTALLRGGLGVGVLFHGKRIQDDEITSLQSVPPVLLAFNSPKNCVNRW
ncbi:hypothetical protein Nepgr_027679 [Nepenthes gracilis]|uniref:Telomere repeat-binding protein 1-6-like ubiquitin-like domain-containing protein n=1 Tax=Nepenthes gracilis TaxID=150966 RepID=A0AAD3TBT9_NEPGR|nr:hypothetical protein Nepgr_027679 [Nepenthes gracilis]